MNRKNLKWLGAASMAALLVTAGHAQEPQRGRGGAPRGPAGAGRGSFPAPPPLMEHAPTPAIANAKPARSCESLANVALPNTTIESGVLWSACRA